MGGRFPSQWAQRLDPPPSPSDAGQDGRVPFSPILDTHDALPRPRTCPRHSAAHVPRACRAHGTTCRTLTDAYRWVPASQDHFLCRIRSPAVRVSCRPSVPPCRPRLRAETGRPDTGNDGTRRSDRRRAPQMQSAVLSGAQEPMPRSRVRQVARDIAETRQYEVSMKLCKKVEMLLAHLKRIPGLRRLRLRGPCGANDEFLLAATAQNLRILAKIFPAPQKARSARKKRRLP